ncbi:patatin-like phospholipase domain-containing protein 2 isoform X1 [Pantherophis guttatus]|uniref:Patatin-like phospholipase domain-containing protein 2 isoform X1 n=1 Tax=Pantherophis guttatus TaxID=94885 RepID=A0ABM3YVH0_PANGU|nr:patatin-like phospholipase domain-containing protein 2 isoform X1 [Pantherophis guttatus]
MVELLEGEDGWSVSFAGCGFLGVYHIGVATCLQERVPRLLRDARCIYGASAGALAGAVLIGGGSLAQACADVFGLAKEARKRNLGPLHPSFNVIKIIRDSLCKNLPENSYKSLSGKLSISLTRVSDGENVLISDFNSKEEVVQALLCSSFVPVYCGLIPPSFRGVRYVDGGLSDNLPRYNLKNTITVSPFSGECDICPKGNSANFHEMHVTNTSIQFSLGNMYRLTQALFPPEPQLLAELCKQGYSDALRFLKENGFLQESVSADVALTKQEYLGYSQISGCSDKKNAANKDKKEMQDEKVFIDQLKATSWPLDGTIFEKLPPRLHKALQEACKEKSGLYAQLSKFLPMRLMSYMMLPYTLPVESAFFVAIRTCGGAVVRKQYCRLLLLTASCLQFGSSNFTRLKSSILPRLVQWFPDIPEDVRWMQGQLSQMMGSIYGRAMKELLKTPSKVSEILLRKCQTAPGKPCLHLSYPPPKASQSSPNLEEWLWSLPYCEDLMKEKGAVSNSDISDSVASFFMDTETSGMSTDIDSSSEKSFYSVSED